MDIVKALKQFQQKLDPLISDYLDKKIRQFKRMAPGSEILVEQIKDLTLRGGDRIRPALMFYGFTAHRQISNINYKQSLFSRKLENQISVLDNDEVVKLAMSLELFHTFALIHDDIMDKALTRRGGKTVHQIIGIDQAILAGDLALCLADELWSQSQLPEKSLKQARVVYEQMKEEVIAGQILDISYSILDIRNIRNISEKEILRMYELKTARYGFARPLIIGAVLGGSAKQTREALFNYGVNIGTAFQLRDDWLGMFGKVQKTGKPVDSDLKEGKVTLLMLKTIDKLKTQNSNVKTTTQTSKLNKLLRAWGNENASAGNLCWAQKVIRESGAEEYCLKRARRLVEKGKKELRNVKINPQTKEFLLRLADFAVEREY